MAKETKVFFDATATFVGVCSQAGDLGDVKCNMVIDGLKFENVLMSKEVWEYLYSTAGKTRNTFWMARKKSKTFLIALKAENGEYSQRKPKSIEYAYLIFISALCGSIPVALIWIAWNILFNTLDFYIQAAIIYGVTFYWFNKRVKSFLDVESYTAGEPADIGERVFGT